MITPDTVRAIALSLPEASEEPHHVTVRLYDYTTIYCKLFIISILNR
ncbi:MAG: hypothetical protein HUU34_16355 [Saprospiraceae bacterium]|nr:hypothetical protein [Saprospiraceae bacterium]